MRIATHGATNKDAGLRKLQKFTVALTKVVADRDLRCKCRRKSLMDSDFHSSAASFGPAAAPAVEQLRVLQEEALRQGRSKDASEYASMMNLMVVQREPDGISLGMKAVFAVVLGLALVVVIRLGLA